MTDCVLGIDVGRNTGMAVVDIELNLLSATTMRCKEFLPLHDMIVDLIDSHAPTAIVVGKPNRRYNVIKCHSEMIGIVKLVAEKYNLPVVEYMDSHCKAVAIGNGRASKDDIMDWTGIDNEHVADAIMFCHTCIIESQMPKNP